MMKNLKLDGVSEEISREFEQMEQELIKGSGSRASLHPERIKQEIERKITRRERKEKTARQRRETQIVQGLISLFSGVGLMIFLYFLSARLVLKLPENIVAGAPFEIGSLVHTIWLVGLIPALTGVGRILAGLTIRPEAARLVESPSESAPAQTTETNELPHRYEPASITEHTTNILNRGR
jgi:hypothetical protein